MAFITSGWLFARTMSKREESCDCTRTEWACGWFLMRMCLCVYMFSVRLEFRSPWLLLQFSRIFPYGSLNSLTHRICLPNKTNSLLCMGMRLSLPARAHFYSNTEQGKPKTGGRNRRLLKERGVKVGCVQKHGNRQNQCYCFRGRLKGCWRWFVTATKMNVGCWHAV